MGDGFWLLRPWLGVLILLLRWGLMFIAPGPLVSVFGFLVVSESGKEAAKSKISLEISPFFEFSFWFWVTPRSAERFPYVYWDRVHLGEMKQTRDI